jgi:hypothetical protein
MSTAYSYKKKRTLERMRYFCKTQYKITKHENTQFIDFNMLFNKPDAFFSNSRNKKCNENDVFGGKCGNQNQNAFCE